MLTGVGVSAACVEIAHTLDQKEKNEVFVETVASTVGGGIAGMAVGAFVISSPVSWGTVLLLAIGSAVASWGTGVLAKVAYDINGNELDLVTGYGVSKICR